MKGPIHSVGFSAEIVEKGAHYHDCHQIILVTRGSAQFYVNGAKQTAGPGQLVIVSRYENHSVQALTERYERYVLELEPSANDGENRLYRLLSNRPEGFRNVVDAEEDAESFRRLFERIIAERGSGRRMEGEMLELMVNELLIMLLRRIAEPGLPMDEKAFETAARIQRRFETRYGEAYTLAGLAKEYNVSVSSLSHRFRAITGASVMGYLTSCRMAAAKKALTETELEIGEIVEQCGFSDSSNFSRSFRRETGMSPSAFRRAFRR